MNKQLRIKASEGVGVGVELRDSETGELITACWDKCVITIEAGKLTKAEVSFNGVWVDVVGTVAGEDIAGGDDAE